MNIALLWFGTCWQGCRCGSFKWTATLCQSWLDFTCWGRASSVFRSQHALTTNSEVVMTLSTTRLLTSGDEICRFSGCLQRPAFSTCLQVVLGLLGYDISMGMQKAESRFGFRFLNNWTVQNFWFHSVCVSRHLWANPVFEAKPPVWLSMRIAVNKWSTNICI